MLFYVQVTFVKKYNFIICLGSFQRQDYSFKTYIPSTGKVEDSQIPGEDEDDEMISAWTLNITERI